MIAGVERKLVRWGEWMTGCRSAGASGPAFPAYQLVHARGDAGSEMLCDAEVMEIDRAMAYVKVNRPELYETAYGRYVQGLSDQTIAGRMRCHRDTVNSRINSLHKIIETCVTTQRKAVAVTNA